MTLQDITTPKCMFDIHSPSLVEDMESIIPEVSHFVTPIPIIDICRYLVLVYDINSPMLREVRTYYERKARCAEILNFPTEKGSWMSDVEDMLIGKNAKFNELIASYISNQGLPEYMQLIAYMEIHRMQSMLIFSGKISDKSDQILARVTVAIGDITRKLFGSGEEDEVTMARKALYQRAQKDKTRMIPKPEDMVKILEADGELPEGCNPYGDDYSVEESYFMGDVDPNQ